MGVAPSRLRSWIPAGVLLVAAAALIPLSAPPERRARGKDQPHLAPLLPRPEVLRVLFAAQQYMVADYYWIRTLEATGRAMTAGEYRDIYDYCALVVDLDPDFEYAYLFGGAAVTYPLGREKWTNTEESTDLLQRGMRRFPRNLQIRVLLAFNLSFYHQRFKEAADLLAETAKMPGAPSYLGPLAARLYARGGDIDAGISLSEAMAESAEDPLTRETMQLRRKELELERILRRVDAAADAFKQEHGRRPASVEELTAAGADLGDLTDPLGGKIIFDPAGRAVSSVSRDRMIVYGLDKGHKVEGHQGEDAP